jgi:hypothetical protein
MKFCLLLTDATPAHTIIDLAYRKHKEWVFLQQQFLGVFAVIAGYMSISKRGIGLDCLQVF